MPSIVAVRNALYAHLTACGPYNAKQISTCSFDHLENTAACALVYLPEAMDAPLRGFEATAGANAMVTWRLAGRLYIKDTGDPIRVLGLVWSGIDDLYTTLAKDTTLGGVVQDGRLTALAYTVEAAEEAGGQVWQRINWTYEAEQY